VDIYSSRPISYSHGTYSRISARAERCVDAARWLLGLVLLYGALMSAAFAASAGDLQEAVLEVTLNPEVDGEMMVVLRGAGGVFYLQEEDFAKLRLHLPQTQPTLFEGRRYYSPAAIRGSTVNIDEARQRAVISVPAWAIETTHLSAAERRSPAITPAAPGAFLN